jgi:flavin-binding protein dodecin
MARGASAHTRGSQDRRVGWVEERAGGAVRRLRYAGRESAGYYRARVAAALRFVAQPTCAESFRVPDRWRTGGAMAIHKVIEVISQSEKSWEDAAQRAVADAGKTVDGIKSIWIKNFEAVVRDNRIVEYRVNANITFEVRP